MSETSDYSLSSRGSERIETTVHPCVEEGAQNLKKNIRAFHSYIAGQSAALVSAIQQEEKRLKGEMAAYVAFDRAILKNLVGMDHVDTSVLGVLSMEEYTVVTPQAATPEMSLTARKLLSSQIITSMQQSAHDDVERGLEQIARAKLDFVAHLCRGQKPMEAKAASKAPAELREDFKGSLFEESEFVFEKDDMPELSDEDASVVLSLSGGAVMEDHDAALDFSEEDEPPPSSDNSEKDKETNRLVDDASTKGECTSAAEMLELSSVHRNMGQMDLAMDWSLKAFELGSAAGAYNIGLFYRHGLGVEEDPASAFAWFSKAAESGHSQAMLYVATAYIHGTGVDTCVSTGIAWLERSIRSGNADAFLSYGNLFSLGIGVVRDPTCVVHAYYKGARRGSVLCIMNLARCYLTGYGVRRNFTQARRLLEKGCEYGVAIAFQKLGFIHYFGLGIPMDHRKAIELYQIAYEKGLSEAGTSLGICYFHGHGTQRNARTSFSYFTEAAERGHGTAMSYLAEFYRQGRVVPTDHDRAIELMQTAADLGSRKSIFNLKKFYNIDYIASPLA